MKTTCPHCNTKFRISDAQLEAAHGQVRCGKCGEVFDAQQGLHGVEAPAPEAPLKAEKEPAPEFDVAIDMGAEPPTVAPDLFQAVERKPAPPIDDLFADLLPPEEPETARAAMTAPELDINPEHPPEVAEAMPASAGPAPDSPEKIFFSTPVDLPPPPSPPEPTHPYKRVAWATGTVALALLLLAQLVDANRATLSRNLVLGPSLRALYAALGRPIPAGDTISAWDVTALNVTSDPQAPGALSITGSLENHADYTQAWPDLRVVLSNQYGEPLRARDFKPAEYLPLNQSNVQLSSGQAVRFRMDIVDPGPDAVGFSLTPCLDQPSGRVCAAEHATD